MRSREGDDLMASSWIARRRVKSGVSYRVLFRLGGRERPPLRRRVQVDAGSQDPAETGSRVSSCAPARPRSRLAVEPTAAPTLKAVAERWQASRVDVRESTRIQHRTALGWVLPVMGDRRVDELTPADVAGLVAALDGDGKARESIRKSVTALAMVLDFPWRLSEPGSRPRPGELLREEPDEVAAAERGGRSKLQGGCSHAAVSARTARARRDRRASRRARSGACRRISTRPGKRGSSRAAIAKTRRARWVQLPDDLFEAVIARLPAREDRTPETPLFASRDG